MLAGSFASENEDRKVLHVCKRLKCTLYVEV